MKRWTKAAALALVFLLCLTVPAAASGAVQFYLTGQADSLNQEIKVDLHPGAGQAVQNTLSFSTPVNRMTMGSAAYVVPQQAGTWVTVDYLTDLNGDGAYDLVTDDAGTPSGDSLTGADRKKSADLSRDPADRGKGIPDPDRNKSGGQGSVRRIALYGPGVGCRRPGERLLLPAAV